MLGPKISANSLNSKPN